MEHAILRAKLPERKVPVTIHTCVPKWYKTGPNPLITHTACLLKPKCNYEELK